MWRPMLTNSLRIKVGNDFAVLVDNNINIGLVTRYGVINFS